MTKKELTSKKLDKKYGFKHSSFKHFFKSNKYAIIITLGFFLTMYYISTIHSLYWTHPDGIFYLHVGEQILADNSKEVTLIGATPGGPVLFAYLNSFIHDGFLVEKTISLLSGTGIVFISYFIMRNFVNYKIALVGQLFVAFNPRLNLLSITALNELLPIFLIFTSLYFVTKKDLTYSNIIIAGIILGIASLFRYQSMIVLLAIVIFLLIRNKKIKNNLLISIIFVASFLIMFSPILVFNYDTYGTMIDSNSIFYLSNLSQYQTPEWHEKMEQLQLDEKQSIISAITYDFDLFIKNYIYNLFYNNSSLLFNFNLLNNISIIPIVPFIGFIPVLGGLVYSLRKKLVKNDFIVLCGAIFLTSFFVFLLGNIQVHFFAIIIIPLLSICIKNIKSFEKNLLPLLILGVVFMLSISIVPAYRSYHLFTIWMLISLLNAIFFVEVIPKIISKIRMGKFQISTKTSNKIIISSILIILLINLGFSYKLIEATFYDSPYEGIKSEFFKLFQKNEPLEHRGIEIQKIIDVLSKQPEIENSYIMGNSNIFPYYLNSKFIFTDFVEGPTNDTINNFITRKNWTFYEIYTSDFNSFPSDRSNKNKPIPDYLIYQEKIVDPNTPWYKRTTPEYISILSDPRNPKIPSNFELIYSSNKTNMIIYKISYKENNFEN